MSFLESIDVLGATALRPSAMTTSTAIAPRVAVTAAPPPPTAAPAPTAVRQQPVISAPAPAPTAVRQQPAISAPVPVAVVQEAEKFARSQMLPTAPPAMRPSTATVPAAPPAMRPSAAMVPQSRPAMKPNAALPKKMGPSAKVKDAAAAKRNDTKAKANAAANRAIAAGRKLARKNSRAGGKLEAHAKQFLRRAQTEIKGEVLGATIPADHLQSPDMTDAEFVQATMNALGVWFGYIEAMNAVAVAGEIAAAVLDLVAQLQAAGQADLASRGQRIADRCQSVIDAFDMGSGTGQTVSAIQADADEWTAEARAALVSGGALPPDAPLPGDALPGDAFASGGGGGSGSGEGGGASPSEEGVDWGDGSSGGGGGGEEPLDPGAAGPSAEALDAAVDVATTEEFAPPDDAMPFEGGYGGGAPFEGATEGGDEFAAIDAEMQAFEEPPAEEESTTKEKEEKPIAAWDKHNVYEIGDRARYEAKIWKALRRIEPPWFPLFMKGEVPGVSAAWAALEKKEDEKPAEEKSTYLEATDMLGALESTRMRVRAQNTPVYPIRMMGGDKPGNDLGDPTKLLQPGAELLAIGTSVTNPNGAPFTPVLVPGYDEPHWVRTGSIEAIASARQASIGEGNVHWGWGVGSRGLLGVAGGVVSEIRK